MPIEAALREKFPALYGKESVASLIEKKELESLDLEPGPGAYFGPDSSGFSAMGDQRFSQKKTEPGVKFARTGWKEWERVFITKGHRPADAGHDVPGAGRYRSMEDLSTLAGDTGVAMPKGKRWTKKQHSSASPGPRYDIRGKHVADVTTNTKKNNACKFSRGDRFQKPSKSGIDVGPGQYTRKDEAIKLDYATAKSFGLGFHAYERVICPGWEKAGQGKESSGPGPPLWRDPLNASDVRTHAIPKGPRWARTRSQDVPGPGHYPRREQDTSNLNCALAQVRNPVSIKFGKPARKPRFRQGLLLKCDNAGWGYF